jgi:hypothetical protein
MKTWHYCRKNSRRITRFAAGSRKHGYTVESLRIFNRDRRKPEGCLACYYLVFVLKDQNDGSCSNRQYVGLEVLSLLTPALKELLSNNCAVPLRREKDNTPFRNMSKFLRICNRPATALSISVRKDYWILRTTGVFPVRRDAVATKLEFCAEKRRVATSSPQRL